MFSTVKQIFHPKNKDLQKKILFTLFVLSIFKIGSAIIVPGIDIDALGTKKIGFLQLMNTLGGGSIEKFSIFSLGVTPYITASIMVQLLQVDIVPYFSELAKQGQVGRNKLNTITRYLGIFLAFVQGCMYAFMYITNATPVMVLEYALVLTAGTAFLLWLGDQITQKGVGNGISMLIFAGIVSGMPQALMSIFSLMKVNGEFSTKGLITAILLVLGVLVLVVGVIFVQLAERRIPVQYSKKVVGRKMMGAQNTHIPIKPAMASVMPIIFASSFMTFPAMCIELFVSDIENKTGLNLSIYRSKAKK